MTNSMTSMVPLLSALVGAFITLITLFLNNLMRNKREDHIYRRDKAEKLHILVTRFRLIVQVDYSEFLDLCNKGKFDYIRNDYDVEKTFRSISDIIAECRMIVELYFPRIKDDMENLVGQVDNMLNNQLSTTNFIRDNNFNSFDDMSLVEASKFRSILAPISKDFSEILAKTRLTLKRIVEEVTGEPVRFLWLPR